MEWLHNTQLLVMDASFWLLLGLLLAGLLKAWLPEALLTRFLGGHGGWPIVKAALVGAPLPLCSCGVLPAALGLRRLGASKGATVSFLVATPETGIDSMAITYAMLGPLLTILRPIAAIFSAITAGLLVMFTEKKGNEPVKIKTLCCAKNKCGQAKIDTKATPWEKTRSGLQFAFVDVLDDVSLWLVVGIGVAGAVVTFVPADLLHYWGDGVWARVLMVVVGIPMYICATASTPLAAAMMLAGISPGTALVFMLTGPATNIGSLLIVRQELGTLATIMYLLGVIAGALLFAELVDFLMAYDYFIYRPVLGESREWLPTWLSLGCAGLLAFLAIPRLRNMLPLFRSQT